MVDTSNQRTCPLKDIETIIIERGGVDADKWPLLLDPTESACTFLKYRNCNYLNIDNHQDMKKHRIRMSIIGGLRYGNPVVVDLVENKSLATLARAFEEVNPHLMEWVMSKQIVKSENYEQLLKPQEDGNDLQPERFNSDNIGNFLFIFVLKCSDASEELKQVLLPIVID